MYDSIERGSGCCTLVQTRTLVQTDKRSSRIAVSSFALASGDKGKTKKFNYAYLMTIQLIHYADIFVRLSVRSKVRN